MHLSLWLIILRMQSARQQVPRQTDVRNGGLSATGDYKTGQDTIFSATEAGNAITELAKGGLTEADIKAGALQTTMDLAASSGMGLGDAANVVVQAMGLLA